MDSSDDLLGEAHDRMFEGDYEGVVLELDPTEPEAFNLLALGLMSLLRFEDAKLTALTWRDLEAGNVQQLAVQLRSSYLAEDAVICNETAREILTLAEWGIKQTPLSLLIALLEDGVPNFSLRFLAKVLATDLLYDQDPIVRETLPALPALTEDDYAADETQGDISSDVLRRWLDVSSQDNGKDGLSAIETLIEQNKGPDGLSDGLDLALALTGMVYLKQQRIDDTQECIKVAEARSLGSSANVIALKALLAAELFTENPDGEETPEKEKERDQVHALLTKAQSSHILLKRRVCKYLQ